MELQVPSLLDLWRCRWFGLHGGGGEGCKHLVLILVLVLVSSSSFPPPPPDKHEQRSSQPMLSSVIEDVKDLLATTHFSSSIPVSLQQVHPLETDGCSFPSFLLLLFLLFIVVFIILSSLSSSRCASTISVAGE
eukprot:766474-Hanusia_phi.AAC.3